MMTAIFLFLPIGIKCFTAAMDNGVFTKSLLIAGAGGIIVMTYPILLLKTKDLDFFKQ
jgi:hypothetical protein